MATSSSAPEKLGFVRMVSSGWREVEWELGFLREVNQAWEEEEREGRPWLEFSWWSESVVSEVDGRRVVVL